MLVLCLAALFVSAFAQSSTCSYKDPQTGYSLSWVVSNGQVNFNLTYPNFPTNSYTGVGWGDSMANGIDAILVSVQGSQVQVTDGYLSGYNPPNLQNDQAITTQSASYINHVLKAQFSRLVTLTSNNHKSLTGCNTWDFITAPGGYNNGQYTKHQSRPQQQQICNIDTACRQGMQSVMNILSPSPQLGSQNQNNGGYSVSNQQNNQGYNTQYNPNQGYPMMQGQGYPMNQGVGPQGNMYQPIGTQYNPNQYGQGQNFGYQPNTATPPSMQPYTGSPFVYSTTMNPTYGNTQNTNIQQNNAGQSYYNGNPQYNPSSNQYMVMPSLAYSTGTGSYPTNNNQNLNNPYQQQPYTIGQGAQGQYNGQNQMMYALNAQQYPPSQGTYNGYYSTGVNNQPSQYQQQSMYSTSNSYGRKRRSIRAKRQTSGYQPTNNIYGYIYSDTSLGSATTAPIVVNPNYKYLSGPLADEYSKSYAQEVTAYDQQQQSGASSQMNLNGNAPILSNQQQNQQNYQQIQRDYARNPNPTAGQTYTNNIYGYNYGGSSYTSTPSPYYMGSTTSSISSFNNGVQRDQSYYTNNNNLFYPANPYSSTASPVIGAQFNPPMQTSTSQYESGSNLKETRLRDPSEYANLTPAQRDYIPGTSAQVPFEYTYFDAKNDMFYPYRTSSNFQPFNSTFYDDGGVVRSSEISSYSSSTYSPISSGNRVYYNPSTQTATNGPNGCALQDPYWCDSYVSIFLNSQEKYNYAAPSTACQQLKTSLMETYNGCCNTVKAAGC